VSREARRAYCHCMQCRRVCIWCTSLLGCHIIHAYILHAYVHSTKISSLPHSLGHRTRAIELGAFGETISSSKLFWDGDRHMAYNQRMLLAPPGHLDRNLGHPTKNCDPSKRLERQRMGNADFTTVTETRIVKSILFGKDVEYGLGHRVRTMDLGVYPHDTSTSRLFWSEEYIIASTPGVSLTWMSLQ